MCKLNLPLALDVLIVLRLTFKPWFMEEPILLYLVLLFYFKIMFAVN